MIQIRAAIVVEDNCVFFLFSDTLPFGEVFCCCFAVQRE